MTSRVEMESQYNIPLHFGLIKNISGFNYWHTCSSTWKKTKKQKHSQCLTNTKQSFKAWALVCVSYRWVLIRGDNQGPCLALMFTSWQIRTETDKCPCLHQSHLSHRWMWITAFPTGDWSQMVVGVTFLSSVKGLLQVFRPHWLLPSANCCKARQFG